MFKKQYSTLKRNIHDLIFFRPQQFVEWLLKTYIFQSIVAWFVYSHWRRAARKKKVIKDKSDLKLMFGTTPIINNKYWSNALKKAGYNSTTIMDGYYSSINKAGDYDIYFEEILNDNYSGVPAIFRKIYADYLIWDFMCKNFDVFHLSMEPTALERTRLRKKQHKILKRFNVKTVVIPYGGDYQVYSRMLNPSLRHALLISYPRAAKKENETIERIKYWTENADVLFGGFQIDAMPRWDLLPFNMVTIDEELWKKSSKQTAGNGSDEEPVIVVHSPNHRGVKGSEFLVKAIEELKAEGLNIQLILLEKVQNEEVRKIFAEKADILVEQLIGGAYALSAIEGMASGIAVITNLEEEIYTRLFRRYSYLNECPILSASPENIKERIRLLVLDPKLRQDLGNAGREYVEKYHSNKMAAHFFTKIYENLFFDGQNDLMNMFHPLMKDSYNNMSKKVEHPLKENKFPGSIPE